MEKKIAGYFTLILLAFVNRSYAQESGTDSKPIVSHAENMKLPSTELLSRKEDPLREIPPAGFEEMPDFIKYSTLKLNLRNFYFSSHDPSDAPNNDNEKVSWAQGGSLLYQSGKLYDVFTLQTQVFTSLKLYGPEDKDGALLLEPGQESYTVLGILNPRFDYEKHGLTLYRQRMDVPYLNSQENRMTPNTFEAYSYTFFGAENDSPIRVGAGYINKIKKRDSDEFVYMSEAAGVQGHDRGMPWLGVKIQPSDEIEFSAVDYAGLDFLNIFYSDLNYTHKLNNDWAAKSSLQYSEQRSIGEDLLTGEDVSVAMVGFQQAISYKKILLRTAVTANDKGTNLISPYGSYAGYNSSIVEDFNRAGEIAWKFGLSYDFSDIGLDGLTAYTDYIFGHRAVDEAKNSLNDNNELDINVDYHVKEGLLNGFWLRVRNGIVHEATVGIGNDFRVILNYDIAILK